MFKNIKDRVNNRFGGSTESVNPVASNGSEENPDVEPDDKEDAHEERRLSFLLEKARKAYMDKGLSGSIEITRSFAAFYRTVSCDIDGIAERASEGSLEEEVEEDEKMSRLQKLAVSGIDRCIKALEKRAHVYRNKSYKSNLTLTSTLYVTAPFVGLVSINISCSATVESLLTPK